MRVRSRLADDFIIDGYQSGAALSIPEESTAPVGSIASICVTTEGVPVVN